MTSIYCQYCGTANNADARFCKTCGRQIESTPQPVQAQPPVAPPQSSQSQAIPAYPQQPVIPLYPAVPATPRKKRGKILLIGILLGLVGCCVAIGGYYQLFLKPISFTARDFLDALQSQQYDSAFNMTSAQVQSQLGSPEGLQTYLVTNGLVFSSYDLTNLQRIAGDPPQGVQLAELTLSDGSKYTMEIDMEVGPGNLWQVIGFGPPAE